MSQLEQLDKNIGVSEAYVRRVSATIDSVSGDIAGLESSLTQENKRLADRQREMTARLRYIYKTGENALPQVVLSSRDMSGPFAPRPLFRGAQSIRQNAVGPNRQLARPYCCS